MTPVPVESILEKWLRGFKQRALSVFIIVLLVYILNGLSHTKVTVGIKSLSPRLKTCFLKKIHLNPEINYYGIL